MEKKCEQVEQRIADLEELISQMSCYAELPMSCCTHRLTGRQECTHTTADTHTHTEFKKLSYCYILKLVYFSLRNTACFFGHSYCRCHCIQIACGQRLSMPALCPYASRSSVSTTAVVSTPGPRRGLFTKVDAACRRPQSFLRKMSGDSL